MAEDLVPYFVGIGSGLLALVVTTPLLSVPPSFPVFASRTIAIVVGGGLLGAWLASRLPGTEL